MPEFSFPEKMAPLLPDESGAWPYYQYVFAPGGRGGGRTRGFASLLILKMRMRPLRWLCAREIQNSIRDSSHLVLRDEIDRQGLGASGTGEFIVTDQEIRHINGGFIMFRGLSKNLDSLKSIEGLNGVMIEEAASVSALSLEKLIPTVIRNQGTEIWFLYNRENENDPVYMLEKNPPPGSIIIEMSLDDNPWASDAMREKRALDYSMDPDRAAWIWGGKCLKNSSAQIMRGKWRVESFEPVADAWDGPYFGMDFGFSQDPTHALEVWRHGNTLYVRHEAAGVEIDIDRYPELLMRLPNSTTRELRCDCSRPESISYIRRHGYPKAIAARKWPGSVEDGVSWLRSHDAIVVHPDCPEFAEECRLYSYKVDVHTKEVLSTIVDKYNHGMDALRYAMEPAIFGHAKPSSAPIVIPKRW